jgi:aminomethyltransferase
VAEGVSQKLVGVTIHGEPLSMWLEDFWPVQHEGANVGRLTSACFSPRLAFNMGYVWVTPELAGEGESLDIESPDGVLKATVTALPFLDPKKDVPKQ